MAKLTRRESEMRRQALLNFYLTNPDATGDEAQEALATGRLTGSKGPPVSQHTLYALKRQAEELRRAGQQSVPVPDPALVTPQLAKLRDACREVMRILQGIPGAESVHVTRTNVTIERASVRQEPLL
jgi:hypothetical protein